MKTGLAIIAIWTLILLSLLLAPIPVETIGAHLGIEWWDKIAHFGLFGITGFISALGARFFGPIGARVFFGIIVGLLLTVCTEALQSYINARNASLYDALSDVAGLSVGLILYALFHYLRSHHYSSKS